MISIRWATSRDKRRLVSWASAALAVIVMSGCLYDPDDRCGASQELVGDSCLCVSTAALIDGKCVPCDDNEVPGDGACVCEPGFERSASGACDQAIPGLGDSCDPGSGSQAGGAGGGGGASGSACPSEGATVCNEDARGNYCTVPDCRTFADCPEDWACEEGEPSRCVRPPTGLGTPCESSSECSTFEADYCETFQEKICMANCLDRAENCHGDWVCCDFSDIIGTAICVPPNEIVNGSCPLGGSIIAKTEGTK